MKLILVEVVETGGSWNGPGGYQFLDYWAGSSVHDAIEGYRVFRVCSEEGTEVAMLELDETATREGFRCSTYPIPSEGPELLEIQFIDVRSTFRGQGVGTWIVRHLEQENPEVQLVALAEGSEEFWAKLGWERILPDERERREMFVSPLR